MVGSEPTDTVPTFPGGSRALSAHVLLFQTPPNEPAMALIKVAATIGDLSQSTDYCSHLKAVKSVLSKPAVAIGSKETLDEEPEYKLILESNRIIQAIDDEIAGTKRFVADIYKTKFPELESLIPNRIDYIRAVKRIGNEMDLSLVNLNDILSNSLIMIVSVSASTTPGAPLPAAKLNECFHGCDEILRLEEDRKVLMQFVESRMSQIAPNLCALIGSSVAALLVGLAGGLIALSKIPSCNVQVMGQEQKNLAGLSNASAPLHTGVLSTCSLVQSCPPALRKKALKIVAGKVALAARIDCYQNNFDSSAGEKLKIEVEERFEKEQAPAVARTKKALPIPEEKKKAKRGGKRMRRMKERFAVTEMQKLQNKMVFTTDAGEYGDSAMGMDRGMVGSKDSGRLRAPQVKESKFLKKQKKAVSVASGQTNGLSSSLAFSTVQGLELVNPNAAAERVREANNKWFSAHSGFLSAAPK
jgi:U4/U6 small nuclear ribonucleoprotein PRP31